MQSLASFLQCHTQISLSYTVTQLQIIRQTNHAPFFTPPVKLMKQQRPILEVHEELSQISLALFCLSLVRLNTVSVLPLSWIHSHDGDNSSTRSTSWFRLQAGDSFLVSAGHLGINCSSKRCTERKIDAISQRAAAERLKVCAVWKTIMWHVPSIWMLQMTIVKSLFYFCSHVPKIWCGQWSFTSGTSDGNNKFQI